MSSVPILIKFVPVDGKLTTLVKTMVVVEALIAPFIVVVNGLLDSPPQEDRPQPNAGYCSAGPTW